MASSIACSTTDLSIDLSRATASAICKSSVLLAAMAAMIFSLSVRFARFQIFLDERVRQNELGFGNGAERKGEARSFRFNGHVAAVEPQKLSPEALSAGCVRRHQFDAGFVSGPARIVG